MRIPAPPRRRPPAPRDRSLGHPPAGHPQLRSRTRPPHRPRPRAAARGLRPPPRPAPRARTRPRRPRPHPRLDPLPRPPPSERRPRLLDHGPPLDPAPRIPLAPRPANRRYRTPPLTTTYLVGLSPPAASALQADDWGGPQSTLTGNQRVLVCRRACSQRTGLLLVRLSPLLSIRAREARDGRGARGKTSGAGGRSSPKGCQPL